MEKNSLKQIDLVFNRSLNSPPENENKVDRKAVYHLWIRGHYYQYCCARCFNTVLASE